MIGIDISKGMVDAANEASSNLHRLEFHVGDCSVPIRHQNGPFDVVFGAWLLNYASNGKAMTNMFRNVSVNLKDSGHFVGITPPATDGPRGHCENALTTRPAHYGDVIVTIKKDVAERVATHVTATMKSGKIEFDAYHLNQSLDEKSARKGGLEGALTWRAVDSPDVDGDVLKSLDSSSWVSYLKVPHFSTLVIAKA